MTIKVSHDNGVFTIQLAFISMTIDTNEIDNTAKDIVYIARLIDKSLLHDEQFQSLLKQKDLFMEALSIYSLGKYSVTIQLDKENNKIHFKDIVMEDTSIDLIKLIDLFNKLMPTDQPQEEESEEEKQKVKDYFTEMGYGALYDKALSTAEPQ